MKFETEKGEGEQKGVTEGSVVDAEAIKLSGLFVISVPKL